MEEALDLSFDRLLMMVIPVMTLPIVQFPPVPSLTWSRLHNGELHDLRALYDARALPSPHLCINKHFFSSIALISLRTGNDSRHVWMLTFLALGRTRQAVYV